jgi:Ni,Fe-hydrogenase maturation factor
VQPFTTQSNKISMKKQERKAFATVILTTIKKVVKDNNQANLTNKTEKLVKKAIKRMVKNSRENKNTPKKITKAV